MKNISLATKQRYRLERLSKSDKGKVSFRANTILLNDEGNSAS